MALVITTVSAPNLYPISFEPVRYRPHPMPMTVFGLGDIFPGFFPAFVYVRNRGLPANTAFLRSSSA